MNLYNLAKTYLAIGIKLGRSYSRVVTFRDYVFEIVVNKQGRSKILSCVRFPELRAPLVRFKVED
jgi:molecular chaperone DnaK (HSP70)